MNFFDPTIYCYWTKTFLILLFLEIQNYKGPYRAQIGTPFYRPRSGTDRVGRFITSLALDRLSYRGHIFPDWVPIGGPPKFLHGFYWMYPLSNEKKFWINLIVLPNATAFSWFHPWLWIDAKNRFYCYETSPNTRLKNFYDAVFVPLWANATPISRTAFSCPYFQSICDAHHSDVRLSSSYDLV